MKNRNGFTIVELLIYMALMAIFITILTRMFTAIVDVQLSSEATGAVEEDGRFIYSRLAYDINRAQAIVTPATPGTTTNTMTILIDGVANTYSVSNTMFVLANDQGVGALNSEGTTVQNLSFQRLGGSPSGKDSIRITFTITSTTQDIRGADTKNIETTIALR